MKLTTETYWNKGYSGIEFTDMYDHSVAIFLDKYLSPVNNKTSIEVGSFPGNFIPSVGRKGYIVSGVDFNYRNSNDLPKWLESLNLKIGEFSSADFFEFARENKKQYDLVCSFGFIEHFVNFEEVILLHAKLVSPGGKLIITTPNFKGWMQYIPHLFFDRRNLKKHHIPSMAPKKWENLLAENGFDITFSGFFGGYHFWVDKSTKRKKLQYLLLRFTERSISQLRKLFNRYHLQSSSLSAYAGIVAQKRIQ